MEVACGCCVSCGGSMRLSCVWTCRGRVCGVSMRLSCVCGSMRRWCDPPCFRLILFHSSTPTFTRTCSGSPSTSFYLLLPPSTSFYLLPTCTCSSSPSCTPRRSFPPRGDEGELACSLHSPHLAGADHLHRHDVHDLDPRRLLHSILRTLPN